MQEILINIGAGERRVAILRSKKLEWYFVERIEEQRIVGNVYKGSVSAALNGMELRRDHQPAWQFYGEVQVPQTAPEGE